ncbi:MAG: uroporphyrinogen-III synthase [Pseudomonadales bacterium]|nr:uroporphyrinogen-III synthase [Pseudomonadales bacterium]
MNQLEQQLDGLRVLLTRQTSDNQALRSALQNQGAQVHELPALEVSEMPESRAIIGPVMDLDQYDTVIFISQNAVQFGMQWIDQYWPQLPVGITWFAIGEKTAQALRKWDIEPVQATTGHDSEALLQRPELQDMKGRRALIVRGRSGRETLAETLQRRGARIDYIEVYQRVMPALSDRELDAAFSTFRPQLIVVFSGETLHNLAKLSENSPFNLNDATLMVPSERVRNLATQSGHQKVLIAEALNVEAICLKIQQWYASEVAFRNRVDLK